MIPAEKTKNLTDCRSIELKVISCKDLKAFNFFQKLSVYAVVSVFHDEMKKEEQQKHMQRQKTPVDRDGDGNPEWNHEMQFDTKDISLVDDCDHLFIKFDMRCEGIIFGKKSLGKVRVPLSDLVDEFNEAVRFVSYQIRTSDGKANGVLNFSYKVIRKKKNNNIGLPNSQKSDSSSEPTNVSDPSDKGRPLYPTLEIENLSRDISYPSLAVVTPPLPRISVPSPKFNCQWRPESYNMRLPSLLPFSLPGAVPASDLYSHPCQLLPFVESHGAYWYPSDQLTNYGHSLCGNVNPAGVGQLGMVDRSDSWKSKSEVLPIPDLGTASGS